MDTHSSSNPEPPPAWMLPDFDPNSAKVSELRSILLENNIPHTYSKKSNLVELFDRQVRPMTPSLLRNHLNVKPSAHGILDMRTGKPLKIEDVLPQHHQQHSVPNSLTKTSRARAQRSVVDPLSSATTSTTTTPATSSKRRSNRSASIAPPSAALPDSEDAGSQVDLDLVPDPETAPSRTRSSAARQRAVVPSSTFSTPARRGNKRKLAERKSESILESAEEAPQGSEEIDSVDVKPSGLLSTPIPHKRRKSGYPIQPSTVESVEADQPIAKKAMPRNKNRRTTLHEAIEAGEVSYSDYNPFQSGPEDAHSGSSGKKPRSSKRKSLAGARSSLTPAQLPQPPPLTSMSYPQSDSPSKLNRDSLPTSPVKKDHDSLDRLGILRGLPESRVAGSLTSLPQSPGLHSKARKSAIFPSPLASAHKPHNRRLTMPHLQDELDGNSSVEQGTPDQILRQLLPRSNHSIERRQDEGFDTTLNFEEERSILDRGSPDVPFDAEVITRSRGRATESLGTAVRPGHSNTSDPTSGQAPSGRQSHVSPTPQTPFQRQHQPHFQTPIPRHPVQRVRLDQVLQTPAGKVLRINRHSRLAGRRSGLLRFSLSQGLTFLLKLGCLGFMLGLLNWYSSQSKRVGYCDTGLHSNAYTRDRELEGWLGWSSAYGGGDNEARSIDSAGGLLDQLMEASRIVRLIPDCQPCPNHARCERGNVNRCEKDYVMVHGRYQRLVNGFLPMLMPPQCLADTEKLVKIAELANDISVTLRQRKGQILCGMGFQGIQDDGDERLVTSRGATGESQQRNLDLERYGMKIEELKQLMRGKTETRRSRYQSAAIGLSQRHVEEEEEDEKEMMVDLAIKDLEKHSEIYNTTTLIVTRVFKSADLGLSCRMKLGFFKIIRRLKTILISLALGAIGWLYARIKLNRYNEEKVKVKELVEMALTKLRDESWVHHTNPSLQPNPSIASAQLRDSILSYEHSPQLRQSLWKKVEKVVEGNSNVRVRVADKRGESFKIWEWIGSYGGDLGLGIARGSPVNPVTNTSTNTASSTPFDRRRMSSVTPLHYYTNNSTPGTVVGTSTSTPMGSSGGHQHQYPQSFEE